VQRHFRRSRTSPDDTWRWHAYIVSRPTSASALWLQYVSGGSTEVMYTATIIFCSKRAWDVAQLYRHKRGLKQIYPIDLHKTALHDVKFV